MTKKELMVKNLKDIQKKFYDYTKDTENDSVIIELDLIRKTLDTPFHVIINIDSWENNIDENFILPYGFLVLEDWWLEKFLFTDIIEYVNTGNSYILKKYEEEKSIDLIMTFSEATEKWGLSDSTLRKMVTTDKLIEGIDYRKSGSTWLITKESMGRVYGEPKK